jgi:hypothetical protein
MTATRRQRAIIVVGAMLVSTLLFGCDAAEEWFDFAADPYTETKRDRERAAQQWEEWEAQAAEQRKAQATPPPQVEPDQVLAEGKVLSVRVDYGNSGATVVEVRIDNDRTGWYDEIEFMCLADDCELGAPPRTYQDYDFGSENFNKQLNHPEWWDPEGVPGDYQVTMEADTGHSRHAVVRWDGEQFVPNLLYFSLD